MKRLSIFFILFPILLFSQDIDDVFNTFLQNEQIQTAHVGLYVENLSNGELIFAHQEDELFVPASVVKIITTDVALSILGEDYTFKTHLAIDGNIVEGTLNGNIIIIGGGDPTLASDRIAGNKSLDEILDVFCQTIEYKGITQINGKIIVDDSIFDRHPPQSWAWEDIANYYGAAAQGLSFQENKYELTFQQSKEGKIPKIIEIKPEQDLIFDNQVLCASPNSGDNAYIMGAPFSKERIIVGTIPAGTGTFTIKGAMPETPPVFEKLLSDYLTNNEIKIIQNEINNLGLIDTLLTISSPKLNDIATKTNHHSINLFAEHLLKILGFKIKGEGTTDKGIEVIEDFIGGRILPSNGIELNDGSGLSRKNLLSPKFIVKWLKQSQYHEALYSSLPIAGESGTMKYFNSAKIKGKVSAKSGSADGILNYAGYIEKDNGERLAFAFFINNYTSSRQQLRREMIKVIESLL